MTHPAAAHPAVAPVGFWDRLAIVVLGLAGCALSYDALQQMAVAIHIRGFLTYLFPLVIDGFIAYGVRALLVLAHAPLRARLYVWVLFGTATAASIWANALHAVRLNQQTTHSGLRLSDTVVAILSTLAPLALAGAVHLYILITRYRPADRERAEAPTDHTAVRLEERNSTDHARADHERGPAVEPGPQHADQGASADRMPGHEHPQTTDHRTGPAPADHTATGPGQRTAPAADHADQQPDRLTDHESAVTDQRTADGPQEDDSAARTSKTAGQGATSARGPADHARADHEHGLAEEPGPQHADQGAPADRMPDHEHPQTTDHASRTTDHRTESAPADHTAMGPDQRTAPAADHADPDADQQPDRLTDHESAVADQNEEGSSGGPQGARTAGQDALDPDQRSKRADQEDEVPWDVKVAVARQAALAEGRMTRQAIRPHLRAREIKISNEHFGRLQDQLYADPALAHLPRDKRRSR